jgi:hypothetical protein
VYELFQDKTLNRRIVYVLLEGILEVLFPANRLAKLFQEYHGKPPVLSVGGKHKRVGSRDLTKSPTSRQTKRPN